MAALTSLYNGIDISDWNTVEDWDAVINSGKKFAMIRAGFGNSASQIDKKFKEHIDQALAHGLKVGITWMSYATSDDDARQEAKSCEELIEAYKGNITFPIAFDYEYDSIDYTTNPNRANLPAPTKAQVTGYARAFCDQLKADGWFPAVYMNWDFHNNYFDMDRLSDIALWFSAPSEDSAQDGWGIWQCGIGETGSTCPGVSGLCDTDVAYKDYPEIIKAAGFNFLGERGESTAEEQTASEPVASGSNLTYSIGEHVVFSTCYKSSTAPIEEAIQAADMQRNHGVITQIFPGTHNTYLLDGGLCFVNDGDIRGAYEEDKTSAPAEPTSKQPSTYTVQQDDTLWDIAQQFLGNGAKYPEIKEANGLVIDTIYPGQTLTIPV